MRDEREAAVVLDGGVRLDDDERLDALGLVAGLFEELAERGVLGRLARVDDPAGDLERERVACRSGTARRDDLVARRDGDDVAPVVAADGERVPAVAPAAVLELDAPDVEDAVATRGLVADAPPLADLRIEGTTRAEPLHEGTCTGT